MKLHALRKGVRATFLSAFDLVCVYVRSAVTVAMQNSRSELAERQIMLVMVFGAIIGDVISDWFVILIL